MHSVTCHVTAAERSLPTASDSHPDTSVIIHYSVEEERRKDQWELKEQWQVQRELQRYAYGSMSEAGSGCGQEEWRLQPVWVQQQWRHENEKQQRRWQHWSVCKEWLVQGRLRLQLRYVASFLLASVAAEVVAFASSRHIVVAAADSSPIAALAASVTHAWRAMFLLLLLPAVAAVDASTVAGVDGLTA